MKFYFTYGIDGQAFVGGWTEIEAPTVKIATIVFRVYHPDRTPGLLNCTNVYTEDSFKKTDMFRSGNFGFRCHETIILKRELADERGLH